jgi:hypothetical protein
MSRSNAANPKKSTVIAEILFGNSDGKLSAISIVRTNKPKNLNILALRLQRKSKVGNEPLKCGEP